MKKETFHVISNTHWDREWYQSHEKYLVRLTELMDRLVEIMQAKPSYRFITDGQYAMVEDYLTVRPEKRDEISALVKEGRLLTGPWYTQPLENIVGGEALIRNLKKGISESEKLGGVMRFSYEIDEFGHTSQLPQILAGFGIDSVMAWRGVPDGCKSYFKWKGPDGTTANFFNSNAGYGEATYLPDCEDDYTEIIDYTPIEREGLLTMVDRIRDLRIHVSDSSHMLWLNGIDHSWAQEDILEICKKIEKLYPEYKVIQSTPREYADAVIKDITSKGITPDTAEGELMYNTEPVLESTNALHPRQKRRHYESEKLLVRQAEPITAAAHLLGAKHPKWAIDRAWGYVLENHAHDSLGCCSVDEVFEQVMSRYGASISLSEQISSDAFRYVMSCGKDAPSLWLFNLSEKPILGAVKAVFDIPEGYGGDKISLKYDGEDIRFSTISVETLGDVRYNPCLGHPTWGHVAHFEAIIDSPEIPAFGAIRLDVEKSEIKKARHRQDSHYISAPNILENKNIKIEINSNGTFTLTDKKNGNVYPNQVIFTDDGESANCYIHEEPINDPRRFNSTGCKADICSLYDTELGAAFEIKIKMEIPKGITADRKKRTEETDILAISTILELGRDDESVSIRIHADNKCRNHRLRVLFPSYLKNAVSSESGQAFDEVERSIVIPETAKDDKALYATKPMQDYCAVSEKNAGLGVSARGIYEYECLDDDTHALALTLLRSIEVIDNDTFEITPSYFMEESQNICSLDWSLSLIPYDGNRESLIKEVHHTLMPVIALANRDTEDSVMPGYKIPDEILPDRVNAVKLSGDSLEITSFYVDDNALIVRVRNRGKKKVNGSLEITLPGFSGKKIYTVNLEGKKIKKVGDGNNVKFAITPAKLITFRFDI